MATQGYTEANTTARGELRWQYKQNDNWRTCSDKHSRALTTAHELNQSQLQINLRRKEYLAKWDNSDVLSVVNAGGFAQLISMKEIKTNTTAVPEVDTSCFASKFNVHVVDPSECGTSASTPSAGAKLQEKKAQRKAQHEEKRGQKHDAARTAHSKDKEQWAQKLADEDDATKAQRAALALENKSSVSNSKSREEGPSDKRSRRVDNGFLYAAGVAKYRARSHSNSNSTKILPRNIIGHQRNNNNSSSTMAQVLVRARPLFAHEVERGEWDSVTIDATRNGVVVHEGTEKIIGKQGLIKVLRHHTFKTAAVTTDDELYEAVCHLPQRALNGGRATLFCYGMTGSGKTYSMDKIHQRLPATLFASVESLTFSAYELLGKKVVDMLPVLPMVDTTGSGTTTPAATKTEVFLRVDKKGATRVYGVAEHTASNAETLQQLLQSAVARRETSATGANATSSRSHAVYSLRLPSGGQLTLIDLAGSEGNHETLFHSAKHTSEAKEINKSLATLRACLKARASKSKTHAPYRESILTRVLKDALTDPAASATLLACVSPACTHLEHSLRTVNTAMFLTGGVGKKEIEEEVLVMPVIREDGPKKWNHTLLKEWIASQEVNGMANNITLPKGMTGKEIMKLPKSRLKGFCNDDMELVELLFVSLRQASKLASTKALQRRQEMLKAKRGRESAAGFARGAPSNPTAADVR
mgnify:CR=1 FL=1|jgi:kinesin family protein 2/24